ncbi:hypothetical protein OFB79_24235, partial [Escherichia coli]|nr:hypothetical protein [Escherichia coli]
KKVALIKTVIKKIIIKKGKAIILELKLVLVLVLKPLSSSFKFVIPVEIFSSEEDSSNNDKVK